jgi:hypothetical protein
MISCANGMPPTPSTTTNWSAALCASSYTTQPRLQRLLIAKGFPKSLVMYREENDAQNHPQPGENEAKVVTDDAEDDVGGIAGATFELAAAEVTFCLHPRLAR